MNDASDTARLSAVSRRAFIAGSGAMAAAVTFRGNAGEATDAADASIQAERDKIRAEQDRPRKVSEKARRLLGEVLTIDAVQPQGWSAESFRRHKAGGFDFVSVSVGDFATIGKLMKVVAETPECVFVRNWDEVVRARESGRLAIAINSQNSTIIDGDLELVRVYRSLGLVSMNLAYNVRNAVADGCAEVTNNGLSRFGRLLVKELKSVGVLCDGAHSGHRSSLEAIELYEGPFVFSHANCKAVFDHYRNIADDQIKACAASGGVIGINGVGRFLNDPYARAEAMFRHVDHVVSLVGWQHVGIGLDWIRDIDRMYELLFKDRYMWPDNNGRTHQYATFSPPEVVGEVVDLMIAHGYPEHAIKGYLGENFQRVLRSVWV